MMNNERILGKGERERERGWSQVYVWLSIHIEGTHFVGSFQSHNINLSSAAYLKMLCFGVAEDKEP